MEDNVVRVLQKLLKYFNGTFASTSFVSQSPVSPVLFCLKLNKVLLPGKVLIT